MASLIGSQVNQLFSVLLLKKPHLMIVALFLLLPKKTGNYKELRQACQGLSCLRQDVRDLHGKESSIQSKVRGWGGPARRDPVGDLFSFSETDPHILCA